MQQFDPVLETRVLKSILDKKEPTFIVNLSADWFGLPLAREIWERLQNLKNNGKQFPSLQTFVSDPVLSEGAQTLLKGDVPAFESHEIEHAMEQLNYYRQGRVMGAVAKKVTELLVPQQGDILQAKVTLERGLAALQNPDMLDDLLTYGFNNDKAMDFYEETMNQAVADRFMQTGFKFIDKTQGGLGRGRLYTFGAPSGGGKSTLANQLSIQAHLGGLTPYEVFVKGIQPTQAFSVNYNTFEMGKAECLLRNQPNLTRIPSNRFQLQTLTAAERKKSDQIFARFLAHGEKFGKRLEYNCPSRDLNVPQLITMIEPMNFDIVVIDYINLMATINPKESMWWNIGEAFRLMKRFAERTRCAVIMVVQIDDETKNIKYAKSIRHHSDGVWLWDWNDAIKEAGGLVEVDQNKLRNFAPCKFNLQAEFEYCGFSESFGNGADASHAPSASTLKPMTL